MKKKVMKLEQEFYDKWIEALKSDKFEQTQSTLCDADGYCCLGVAFRILGVDSYKIENDDMPSEFEIDYLEEIGYPKSLVDNESLLANLNDGFSTEGQRHSASQRWNLIKDDKDEFINNYTFKQIAEFLEMNVEIIQDEPQKKV